MTQEIVQNDFEKGSCESDTTSSASSFFNMKMMVGVLVAIVSVLAVVILAVHMGWLGGSSSPSASAVSNTNTDTNVPIKDVTNTDSNSSIQNSSDASQDAGNVPDDPNSNGQIGSSNTNGQQPNGLNNQDADQEQAEPTGSVLRTQENVPVQSQTESTDHVSSSEAASEIKDRIFFILNSNAEALYDFDRSAEKIIMSVDEDGNDLRSHGSLGNILLARQPSSNKAVQKFVVYFVRDQRPDCLIQDWNSTDLSDALFDDKLKDIPSFSQDGKKLLFSKWKTSKDDIIGLSVYDLESKTVTDELVGFYDWGINIIPKYSHDEKSVFFIKMGNRILDTIYKWSLEENARPVRICSFYSDIYDFLVSPTEEKLFKIDVADLETNLVLVDTSDNLPEGAQRETVLVTFRRSSSDVDAHYELVSWSSDGEFIYMLEHHDDKSWALVKMNIRNGEMTRLVDSTNVQ